jgi:hypothetical protein
MPQAARERNHINTQYSTFVGQFNSNWVQSTCLIATNTVLHFGACGPKVANTPCSLSCRGYFGEVIAKEPAVQGLKVQLYRELKLVLQHVIQEE